MAIGSLKKFFFFGIHSYIIRVWTLHRKRPPALLLNHFNILRHSVICTHYIMFTLDACPRKHRKGADYRRLPLIDSVELETFMYLSYLCLLLLVVFQSLFSRYSVLSESYKLLLSCIVLNLISTTWFQLILYVHLACPALSSTYSHPVTSSIYLVVSVYFFCIKSLYILSN